MLLTVEEIGNIAEVTGEREGAHTFAVALEIKLIEKLCAGVEMPEPVGKVIESEVAPGYIDGPNGSSIWTREKHIALKVEATHDQDFGASIYTADQLRAYGAACRLKALEDAVEAIDDECRDRVVTASDCIDIIRALKGEA